MTVVLVKSECPRHSGIFTLSGECPFCITEEFRAKVEDIFAAVSAVLGDEEA